MRMPIPGFASDIRKHFNRNTSLKARALQPLEAPSTKPKRRSRQGALWIVTLRLRALATTNAFFPYPAAQARSTAPLLFSPPLAGEMFRQGQERTGKKQRFASAFYAVTTSHSVIAMGEATRQSIDSHLCATSFPLTPYGIPLTQPSPL
jgi:hypothetical protein